MRDPGKAARQEVRDAIKPRRRRKHLVMLGKHSAWGWAPRFLAVVRLDEAALLQAHHDRIRGNLHDVELRVAQIEDGAIDIGAAWCAGLPLARLLREVPHAR